MFNDPDSVTILIDPAILRVAQSLYRAYYEITENRVDQPIGVAVDRFTYRGQLVFGPKPILLPEESFVPISALEDSMY
jgi:hypothetical protein